jgi:hypothetical protein
MALSRVNNTSQDTTRAALLGRSSAVRLQPGEHNVRPCEQSAEIRVGESLSALTSPLPCVYQES